MKKEFPCGHKGKGKYCHRCKQENERQIKIMQQQKEKEDWKKSFDNDVICLRKLSTKTLVLKARKIIDAIEKGSPYRVFKGKRLNHDRKVISVPVNSDFRLIYHEDNSKKLFLSKLQSHEEYNITKPK